MWWQKTTPRKFPLKTSETMTKYILQFYLARILTQKKKKKQIHFHKVNTIKYLFFTVERKRLLVILAVFLKSQNDMIVVQQRKRISEFLFISFISIKYFSFSVKSKSWVILSPQYLCKTMKRFHLIGVPN